MLPPLNVTLTGGSDGLMAGQNHTLTCVASGGGSMAYTYMWLKDGIVIPGQTSSTFSFSSLEIDDSGQYSCRVTVGSMTVTSRNMSITVVGESGIGGCQLCSKMESLIATSVQ